MVKLRSISNLGTSFRAFFALGFVVIFLIVFISVSFYQAIYINLIQPKKVTLNKQVELIAKNLRQEFDIMYDDMMFFSNLIEKDVYESPIEQQIVFEQRTRRVLNTHRKIIDRFLFHLTEIIILLKITISPKICIILKHLINFQFVVPINNLNYTLN